MSRASAGRSASTHSASLSRLAAKINRRRLSSITLANVLAGHTCSPISLSDFEAYLALKEHSLENLHFAVWYQSYRARYLALASPKEPRCKTLSTHFALPSPVRTAQRTAESRRQSDAVCCPTPSPTSSAFSADDSISRRGSGAPLLSPATSHFPKPSSYHPRPSAPLQPLSVAPDNSARWRALREECARATATFLSAGSPREIILDGDVRDALLRELTWNIHPDAFLSAYEAVMEALETYSMPRFLAHASANINRPKQIYWYAVGIVDMLLGIALAVLLIVLLPNWMSEATRRAWRLTAVPLFSLGSMQAYSAWRGFCSEVWGRGNTQLRVWELEGSDPEATSVWGSHVPSDRSSSPRPRMQENVITLPSVFEDEREGRPSLQQSLRDSLASGKEQSKPSEGEKSKPSEGESRPGEYLDIDVDFVLRHLCGNSESTTDNKGEETRLEIAGIASPSCPPRANYSPSQSRLLPHQPSPSLDPWGWEKPPNARTRPPSPTTRAAAKAEYRRPPVFGPERPVLDPRIREVHRAVMRDMLAFGFVCTALFAVVVLAVPSVNGR
ncbi:hypothetical protein OH77DRAFT_1424828 [Trametes cingulata]|nr:hypothetical protein OH77DRAFT_1424828 [Trametes cingulata]